MDAMTLGLLGTSCVFGGRGSDWFQPGSRAAAELLSLANAATPRASEYDAAITVVFHVAGGVFQPDFSGMNAGRLTKADRGLVVEVAVPAPVHDPCKFIGRMLVEAVAFAQTVFARRRVPADFSRIQVIAESVAAELGADPTIAFD